MQDTTEREPGGSGPPAPFWLRLAWFAGLWAAGVLTVAIVAYGLRLAIR